MSVYRFYKNESEEEINKKFEKQYLNAIKIIKEIIDNNLEEWKKELKKEEIIYSLEN